MRLAAGLAILLALASPPAAIAVPGLRYEVDRRSHRLLSMTGTPPVMRFRLADRELASLPPLELHEPASMLGRFVFRRQISLRRARADLFAGPATPLELDGAMLTRRLSKGHTYNVVIDGDDLLIAESGAGLRDLWSKHAMLADFKPMHFVGTLRRFDDDTLELSNATGTYRTPEAYLEPTAAALRRTFGLDRLVTRSEQSLERFSAAVDASSEHDYHGTNTGTVDETGDIMLLRLLHKMHGMVRRMSDSRAAYTARNRDRASMRDRARYRIGREKPFTTAELMERISAILDAHSELVPHVGPEHVWSQNAILHLHSRGHHFIASKLLTTLTFGETSRYLPTGIEAALKARLAERPDGSVDIPDLFAEAYVLASGDLYRTLLACQNILSENRVSAARDSNPIQKKLKYVRKDSAELGDNFGAWYHFFGTALYALMRGPSKAGHVARIENIGSRFWSYPDRQEEWMNRLGVEFGAQLKQRVARPDAPNDRT
jgi:hypothetical protein